jgi:hypothetical protein
LALLTGALLTAQTTLGANWWLVAGGGFCVALLFCLVWLPGVAWRQYTDARRAKEFLDAAENLVRDDERAERFPPPGEDDLTASSNHLWAHWKLGIRKLWNFAYLLQIGVTVFLVCFLVSVALLKAGSGSAGASFRAEYSATQPTRTISLNINNQ